MGSNVGVIGSARVQRIANAGQIAFAVVMIGIGILGLVRGRFTPTWAGVPPKFPARDALVYLTALISLAAGIGLLVPRAAANTSRALLGAFTAWMLVFKMPAVFSTPADSGAWWAVGDTAVMMGAAWVLYVWFAGEHDRFGAGPGGLRIARALYGIGLIPFGVAHFTFLDHTVSMVPGWLPWHLMWADFFGITFIAAGVAAVTGVWARLAVALSAVQLGLFTLLVWGPVVVSGRATASDWAETVSSVVLTVAAWVVAESYGRAFSVRASSSQGTGTASAARA
ncbi:MAG TPA: hypothetical protein VGI97_01315 [Gemmatimonadaceae bacterium]|jgi:uncharacterized membrane protein